MKWFWFMLQWVFLVGNAALAQTGQNCIIKYSYNTTGNRIQCGEFCGSGGGQLKMENLETVGQEEETQTVDLQTDQNLNMRLFPNPTSGNCVIVLSKEVTNAKMEVFDYQGKTIQYKRINGTQFEVNLSKYPSGSYIIAVSTDRKRVSKTVIKN